MAKEEPKAAKKENHARATFNALMAWEKAPLSSLIPTMGPNPGLPLAPTQIPVGMREMTEHKQKLLRELAEKSLEALDEYLAQKPILVVRGPGNSTYIIDHHHLALALLREGYQEAPIKVAHDFSDCATMKEFWETMQQENLVYLYDEKGRKVTVDDLPQSLEDMKDDPYRSLAWYVREAKGYEKTDEPYMEFQWANYFRQLIDPETVTGDFDKAVKLALEFARLPAAKNLPGYKPSDKTVAAAASKKNRPSSK
jgi:hypothetical protein